MGYSGVKGGMDAILAAERLVLRKREEASWASAEQITGMFRLAVDRVMGEAGLYDEGAAADAFRQAEGDLLEAAHLMRAYRSSLPRLAVTEPADPDEVTVLRRIVPASRTPDGPQLLGRTTDYTARVLDRPDGPPAASESPMDDQSVGQGAAAASVAVGASAAAAASVAVGASAAAAASVADAADAATDATAGLVVRPSDQARRPGRFSELLAKLDLTVTHDRAPADDEPFDVTRSAARPPAPRSAVLSSMARAETGALVALWYRSVRGPDGAVNEVTLGEVRHGRLPLRVIHPLTGNPVDTGTVRVTEVEAIEDLDGPEEDRTRLDIGYGLCFGHNERKAIAMANLDIACRRAHSDELEQLLLLTTDGLDSGGFLEHLKLPHYVTFRSIVDRKLAGRVATSDEATAGKVPDTFGKECQ
ncbi:MAG TPA: carbon-phosphorus lyase complex subunit PhnI [Trebonia sp.]|nr:carbon-phosphorus lyase complex subunit PhnI [Trebonia sp.]